MKDVDLLIFDLDGTLAATGKDLAVSVNYTLKAMGLQIFAEERIISFVGDGIRELLIRSLGPAHQDRIEEAMAVFQAHHHDHILDHTVLYPGVIDILQHFHDKIKIVMSNKRQEFVEIIIRALGVDRFFDRVIGGDAYPYMKPDARLVNDLLHAFGIPPERTVIIGDGRNDILLAKNSRIISCAYLNGLTGRDILLPLNPDYIIEDMKELQSIFK